jgi:hypothetical protein
MANPGQRAISARIAPVCGVAMSMIGLSAWDRIATEARPVTFIGVSLTGRSGALERDSNP